MPIPSRPALPLSPSVAATTTLALDLVLALLAALALLAWITQPFHPVDPLFALPFHTNPLHPLAAAALLAPLRLHLATRAAAAGAAVPPLLPRVPFLALTLASVGYWLAYLTTVCGGADSYGYVSAAGLLRDLRLSIEQPDAAWLPVPRPLSALAPLGYTPAPGPDHHALVPIYPLGLPALMAVATSMAPGLGPYLVPPLMAAAALVFVFLIARHHCPPPETAWLAVALAAWNPLLITYAKQPMSDVTAATWLLAAVWLLVRPQGRPVLAGLAAGASFLTRPGGLGAIAAVGLVGAWQSDRPFRTLTWFLAGLAPGIGLQACLQWALFGHPLQAGYGSLATLYSGAAVLENLLIYARALWNVHPVAWFAAAIAGVALASRRMTGIALAVLAGGLAPYFLYFAFDHWETLRFALPGVILLEIVAAGGVVALASRLARRWMAHALMLGVAVLGVWWSGTFLQAQGVPTLMEAEQRYVNAAQWVRRHTPDDALVFAAQHSGSIRHYAGRTTLRWDVLDQQDIGAVVRAARARGRLTFAVIEGAEVPRFRDHFERTGDGPAGDAGSFPRAGVRLLPGAQLGIVQIWELVPSGSMP